MRRWWPGLMLVGLLLSTLGCAESDPPAPQKLSADEEREFERQQKEGRRGETRSGE
jgi:hypothetical protein